MVSPVDTVGTVCKHWQHERGGPWKGAFGVRWLLVKDVPNALLRHIKLANNDNKPMTNSRDTQEVPYEQGAVVLRVFHECKARSSILDYFDFYERRTAELRQQQQLSQKRTTPPLPIPLPVPLPFPPRPSPAAVPLPVPLPLPPPSQRVQPAAAVVPPPSKPQAVAPASGKTRGGKKQRAQKQRANNKT
eukprot:TRINITY_DN37_c0_g1_i2.p2 TRINITY_DN37_c0_g1~~TRINITY_DN37_c0_g1_i2.p2  ORF type:complete len:189 (+),score=65.58 TRINITY_DN37_c0_g1_i2:1526-2092(+)